MKKKILSSMLVAAMAASMIVGCGSDAPAAPATPATPSNGGDTTTPAAPAADATTITVYRCSYNVAAPDEAQVKKVETAINEYLASKGATVQIDLHDIGSGEYGQKANLAFNNGEVDLLWHASWWGDGIGTNDIYANNGAYDLTDLIAGSLLESSMDSAVWEGSKYDGKIYFVPVYKEAYEGYDLKIPVEKINKYGWDVSTIKELKDIEPMLADLKADGIEYPYAANTTAMFYRYYIDKFDFFTQNALFGVDRETNEVVDPILSDEYAEFCKLMGSWYQQGYISDGDLTKSWNETYYQDPAKWGISWWTCVPGGEDVNSSTRDKQEEVIIDGITGKYMHSTTTLGSCYCVSSSSTEAEAAAAVEFLGLLNTDNTLADLYTFGIEGEDYTIENGFVAPNPEKYGHSAWESTSVKALSLTVGEPEDKVADYIAKNGAAVASCAAGFRFNKAPVEAKYTACVAIMEEDGYQLELGAIAPDKVDAFIADYQAKLDAAGYQDVLAEFQAQYDAWK